MKSTFSDEDYAAIKSCFTAYLEIAEQKKQLANELKAVKDSLKKQLECKSTEVTQLLNILKSRYDGEESAVMNAALAAELMESHTPTAEEEATEKATEEFMSSIEDDGVPQIPD